MPQWPQRAIHPSRTGVIFRAVFVAMACAACTDDAPSAVHDVIDRETFIDVYVDLRHVALHKTSRKINPTERDSVLTLHDVTEEDLRQFLDVYHTEAEYMRDVWNDVEARISLMLQMANDGAARDG